MEENFKKNSYNLDGVADEIFQPSVMERIWNRFDKKKLAGIAFFVVLVVAAVTVAVVLVVKRNELTILPYGNNNTIECPAKQGTLSYHECFKKGCEWRAVSNGPSCYHPSRSNYYVASEKISTRNGFVLHIQYNSNVTLFTTPYLNALFKVTFDSSKRVTFEISKLENEYLPFEEETTTLGFDPEYDVIVDDSYGEPFNFAITRKEDNKTVWDSSISGLVLEEQFLQISTYLPSSDLFGMGENVHTYFKRNMDYKKWTIFSRHTEINKQTSNLGGFHPFYICIENSGKAHTTLLHNTHAVEYVLLPAPGITFRVLGGSLKFSLFLGNSPGDAIRQSSQFLGTPSIIPYWALGIQISPVFNIAGSIQLPEIVNKTKKLLPVDGVYLDTSLWKDEKTFNDSAIDENLLLFLKTEHASGGTRFVVLLDAGIRTNEYRAFEQGVEDSVFITWHSSVTNDQISMPKEESVSKHHRIVFGTRTPEKLRGIVAFPDFTKRLTRMWWHNLLLELRNVTSFQGIFLIRNEPYSVGTNEDPCWGENCWSLKCPNNKWDDPPFVPGSLDGRLSDGSICMSGVQGDENETLLYESHNLYGMQMVDATAEYFQKRNERSFIISQSTTSIKTNGNPSGHWLATLPSTWEGMRRTIVGMLDLNLFGIPYVGSEICGKEQIIDTQLCKRWIQLALFYPFVKVDFRVKDSIDLDKKLRLIEQELRTIVLRYTLLPYMYTVFFQSHLYGDSVIRPLFYEYPTDRIALSIDKQFLWGPSIMVAPVLEENILTLKVYFPNDTWYRLRPMTSTKESYVGGQFNEVGEIQDIPIFVRAGTILACHSGHYLDNGFKNREKPLILKIFPYNGNSSGLLFWDDGTTKNSVKTNKYLSFTFTHHKCEIIIERNVTYDGLIEKLNIREIIVHEAGKADTVLTNETPGLAVFSEDRKILTLYVNIELTLPNISKWTIKWSSKGSCTL